MKACAVPLPIVLVGLAVVLLPLANASPAATRSRLPSLAFGLLFSYNNTAFRSDFQSQLADPSDNWSEISTYAGEYELYYEMLQFADAFPDQGVELSVLAAALNSQGMSMTFQVAGARALATENGAWQCSGVGATCAEQDIGLLQQWVAAGGSVDKLISDNSIARMFTACYTGDSDALLQLVATELAAYWNVMAQTFPGVKFGVTDGFALFQVTDPDGAINGSPITYQNTITQGPEDGVFIFEDYITYLKQSMASYGLTLDEFVMDCSEAFVSDYIGYSESKYSWMGRNYGRMIAGAKVMANLGVGSGIYWEVFSPSPLDVDSYRQYYHDTLVQQVAAFQYMGGIVNHQRLTFWTQIPDISGPETTAYTALNDIRDAMRVVAYPPTLVNTNFHLSAAIFHAFIGTYCLWSSWEQYLACAPAGESVSALPSVSSLDLPFSLVSLGDCAITPGMFGIGPAMFESDGRNYCLFTSPPQAFNLTGITDLGQVRQIDQVPAGMVYDGVCDYPVGPFAVQGSTLYYSFGYNIGACSYTWPQYLADTNSAPVTSLPQYDSFPSNLANLGLCPMPSPPQVVYCSANGQQGTCINSEICSSIGGQTISGLCPGLPDTMQCCMPIPCNTGTASGTCISTSACSANRGTIIPGYCPSSAYVECCLPETCEYNGASGTCMDKFACLAYGGTSYAATCDGNAYYENQCCIPAPTK